MQQTAGPAPLWGPARLARALLVAAALLSALLAVLAVRLAAALDEVDPDAVVGGNEAQDALSAFLGVMSLFGVVLLATGVAFVVWLWRAARANAAFGRPGALGPGWAIGAWFVPVASLVLPAVVVHQLWKGSDPAVGRDDPAWKQAGSSPRLWLWWVSYVVGQVLVFIGFTLVTATDEAAGGGEITVADLVDRLDDVRLGLGLTVAGHVLFVVAAALAAGLVVALSRRQEVAAAVLGTGPSAAAGPWAAMPGDARRSAPPAWLPDPTGRADLRWWDGEAWTDHVSRGGRQDVDPL